MSRTYRRSVIAPECATVHGRMPLWDKAYVDPGGPGSFASGAYLHLPYGGGDYSEPDEVTTRVFFHLDYEGRDVRLVKEDGGWFWVWKKSAE